MKVVIDASAAFEIAFKGKKYDHYREILENAEEVIAPPLFQNEITNTLWLYAKAGYVDMQNAKMTLAYIFQLVDSYENTADCSLEILHEAARLGHSTYDMSYLILARRNASTLLTVDRKLIKLCQDCGVDVE